MWVSHQDLLLGLQAYSVEPSRIITITASTGWSTEAIIRKAFTVELQTSALTAITGLVDLWLKLSLKLGLAEGLRILIVMVLMAI